MSERFFLSNRSGYLHPVCSELDIAVPQYVGGGVCLIKPAKLYMCTQTHYKHDEDGRTAPGVRGHGSVPLEPLRKRRYESWITHTHTLSKPMLPRCCEQPVKVNWASTRHRKGVETVLTVAQKKYQQVV